MEYKPLQHEGHEGPIVRGLSKLQPGRLPLDVFLEVARLTVTPVIEIVPICRQDGILRVLLMKRSDDDPIWAGLWHTPGTVIRAFDETLGDGIDRLLTD